MKIHNDFSHMNRKIEAFSLAIELIKKMKIQPEKAFDISFKKMKLKDNRGTLYQEFLRVIRNYYYYSELYPDKEIEEIVRYSLKEDKITLPQWVKERLSYIKSDDFSKLFYKKTWIRVNTLKANVKEIISSLMKKGFELVKDDFDFLFQITRSPFRISRTEEFQKGEIVIQDKASVYVVTLLDPKPYERILEVGSAPGMKTSLIQQLTNNKAYVIALDISKKRILVQRELMEKLGVENYELIVADGENLPIKEVDKILIDAPCSNSGTINADPSVFLRLNKNDVIKLSRLQKEILREASKLHKPVVYSTCSLFPEEGEKIVEKYSDYLIKLTDDPTHYGYMRSKVWLRVMRFYPHIHGTEGFFISKIDFSK
ncbi:RsmB/NOP family class I SAM-dependent RNA methyltransferase [Sulfolobus sp. S-194]|uniref:RsmB/NOP family class I SAM-dependent RNA methyltransferase n=1 Tax=Sulfolobus sp. S-194 TaxID=2512240 RepID=UPI001436FA4C|nr:RsmB/NOP family class I SAM-dependent RNA methyltransferase [Sulfolobus sp. S-194]QIW23540.1 RsmB/NOP family class I SAM-dependent RNA methyltransferase [Sulfolobus sp. S-194]